MGKKVDDAETVQLKKAFDEKEREWIISDLGLKDEAGAEERFFNIVITKVGLMEKRELNEEFFNQLYPNQDIKTEEELRNKLKEEIERHWTAQANNQIHDQVFHYLVDNAEINFPEGFLKKWIKTQSNQAKDQSPKTDEEVEQEFPGFLNQLKWTLISDKIVQDNAIQVDPEEIRVFAKQQLFSYMGGANLSDDQPWVADYVEKMMKDRKYVEDAYTRIQSTKIFEWAATQVKPKDKNISAEDFTKMVEEHQHSHH
jgi:trigger factor